MLQSPRHTRQRLSSSLLGQEERKGMDVMRWTREQGWLATVAAGLSWLRNWFKSASEETRKSSAEGHKSLSRKQTGDRGPLSSVPAAPADRGERPQSVLLCEGGRDREGWQAFHAENPGTLRLISGQT